MEKSNSYYRNLLKVAKENSISAWGLLVATSVDSYGLELTDDEFDRLSGFVYEWCMGCQGGSPDEVMNVICQLIQEGELKVSDFMDYDLESMITCKINDRI